MGLIGAKGVFVGGNGVLALLLAAEVLAALAVVSEAALVYIARHRNLVISLVALGLQIGLSFLFIRWIQPEVQAGEWPEVWLALGPAAALAISIGLGAVAKSWLAARILGVGISIFRWPMLVAAGVAAIIGGIATGTPEWSEILIGIPAMLGVYMWIIWRFAFEPEDRALFARTARVSE
jgi:hypothetical protein